MSSWTDLENKVNAFLGTAQAIVIGIAVFAGVVMLIWGFLDIFGSSRQRDGSSIFEGIMKIAGGILLASIGAIIGFVVV